MLTNDKCPQVYRTDDELNDSVNACSIRRWIILTVCFLISHGHGLAATGLIGSRPNVLLICVDDLRCELACDGVQGIQTPNLDRLASQSRLFDRHYVQVAACGLSRCTLLTGPTGPYPNPRRAFFSYAGGQACNRIIRGVRYEPPRLPYEAVDGDDDSYEPTSHYDWPGGTGNADLCGLPTPAGLAGARLKPLVKDPNHSDKTAAFGNVSRTGHIGRTLRTDRYRLAHWQDTKTAKQGQ